MPTLNQNKTGLSDYQLAKIIGVSQPTLLRTRKQQTKPFPSTRSKLANWYDRDGRWFQNLF